MAERNLFYEQLEKESSGDYVEVIRCRDCKYYHRYENHISSIFTLLEEPMIFEECKYHKMSTTANDFCSRAERRE